MGVVQRGAVALGGIAVFKWFVVCFAIDLLPLCFFLILSVYPTLDYVHYCEICEQKERERERGERKQQTASCCPISIHLHSRLFFELAQTNLKRFMVIAISPDNELS